MILYLYKIKGHNGKNIKNDIFLFNLLNNLSKILAFSLKRRQGEVKNSYIYCLIQLNMKSNFTLILFCLSLLASGQNYQLFNMNSRKVFKTQDELAKTFSLVFDSVIINTTSTVYYPYKTVGDVGYESDTCPVWGQFCYHQDKPSWLGSEVQFTEGGYNFITNTGSSVVMNFNLAPLQAHIFYEDDLQCFSISRVSPGADTMNILGTVDSVQRYQISHTDLQGNLINSVLNTWEIIIGKELGLVSYFRIDSFPQVLEPLVLMGTESPDAGFYQLTNESVYDYLPGDIIQTRVYYNDPLYPELSWTKYITDSFQERYETSDSLKYKVNREIYIPSSSSFTVLTTWLKYRKDVVIADIPFDWKGTEAILNGSLKVIDYCGLNLWTFHSWDGHLSYCSAENSWCESDAFGFTSTNQVYVEGIGLYDYQSGVLGPPSNTSSGSEINYFSKQGVECGEKVVGLDDHLIANNTLVITPNPTIGSFRIDGINSKAELQIVDVNGRILLDVKNYQSQSLVDISKLPSGMYLVRLIDGKSAKNGKLIVQ